MQNNPEFFEKVMLQLKQDPMRGILRQTCHVEYANLPQEIQFAQKKLMIREDLLDEVVKILFIYWVVSDQDLIHHLNCGLEPARQAMKFIETQLRHKVTLLQDNTRGWILRLKWSFEGVEA